MRSTEEIIEEIRADEDPKARPEEAQFWANIARELAAAVEHEAELFHGATGL